MGGRLGSDLDDISMEYERVHAAALITEKRAKNFDKVLGEWLSKASDVAAEVGASQDEGRNYSSELFRLKAAQDEAVEQLDIVKRENKNLADEIKDLLDQLGEGGRSIHDLDKQRRRLEQKRKSFRQLWRKQKLLWKWKKTKFCVLNLSLLKSDRKLIDVLLRRKMNSTIPGKTMPVLWILLEHQLKLNSVLRERALELRNSLKGKSMSLKLDLTMPTRPTPKD